MARPTRLALERLTHAANGDRRRRIVLVHLARGGREEEIDDAALRDRRVTRFVARIRLEIGRVVELCWIDEQ